MGKEKYRVILENEKVYVFLEEDFENYETYVITKEDLFHMLKTKHHLDNITKKIMKED